MKSKLLLVFACSTLLLSNSCKKASEAVAPYIFSLEDDKKLGEQTRDEIAKDPATYPILSESQYPKAYEHIRRITTTILNSGKVEHKTDFTWEVRLIQNDSVLNAFCAPGGYIYVYTGIIKYLDSEDQLAGVMGHEIAHADLRHTIKQMANQYTTDALIQVIAGKNAALLTQIAGGMLTLKYSRDHESESDNNSVEYLYPTEYDARGAARFFEKLSAGGNGGSKIEEFLSTHPSPDNRVENITNKWKSLGGKVGGTFDSRYADFKSSLP